MEYTAAVDLASANAFTWPGSMESQQIRAVAFDMPQSGSQKPDPKPNPDPAPAPPQKKARVVVKLDEVPDEFDPATTCDVWAKGLMKDIGIAEQMVRALAAHACACAAGAC